MNTPILPAWWHKLLAALVAIAAAFTITIVVDSDGSGPAKPVTLTVAQTIKAPTSVAARAPAGDLQGLPAALRDSTPTGVPQAELDAGDAAAKATAEKLDLPKADQPIPQAGAQLNPCRTEYQTNRASYGSAKSRSFGTVLHYTVGANVPGWADVEGARAYLNRVGLSASDIMDFEGHCDHTVPYTFNAYTQGRFNQYYDSIEIIATGKESRAQWLAAPIFKDHILANYLTDRLKSRGVPLKFVDPVGCAPQAGYTDHNHLECGNDHVDVSPSFPFDVLAAQLHDGAGSVTATDKTTCRKLNWWRTHGRPHGKAEANAVRRKHAMAARHVTCSAKGPIAG
jgi:hypothetical protein